MLTLLFFAFLSGLATIVAPCIWPILPVILSATTTGGRRKPLGIVTGIGLSFLFATLLLSYLIKIIPFDPDTLRTAGVVIIGLLGIMLLVPALGRWLESRMSRLTSFSGRFLHSSQDGFGSGFLIGAALGLVWSPCAGPILATVAVLAATQAIDFAIVALAVTFVIGIAVPLYLFALLGQRIFLGIRKLSPYTGLIQRIFGAIMLAAAIVIYTGYDRVLQTKVIDTYPACGLVLNSFESNPRVLEELKKLRAREGAEMVLLPQENGAPPQPSLPALGQAPELAGISGWLNTADRPLTLTGLRGQVVLIHFWTFGCINCVRTLPFVTGWYEEYRDEGLVVIGIHTPEFAYEQDAQNVTRAVAQHAISYPVALDNDYATWQAYDNHSWPALYLIDATGQIRYTHVGEGKYSETRAAIEYLLQEAQAESVRKE